MLDIRYTKLAETLVHYSCAVQKEDRVFIEAVDIPYEFVCELIRTVKAAGGIPYVKLDALVIKRALMLHGSEASWQMVSKAEQDLMRQCNCYIGMRGSHNISELSDVARLQQDLYEKIVVHPVHMDIRVPNTRWVILRWPSSSMAQQAEMSTEAFEDYFFHVCTLDYAKMKRAMQPLIQTLSKAEEVKITGPGTNLTFSIKGIEAVGCSGHRNIPDGEVFTAPVKDSVEGVIQYNVPTIYRGETHLNTLLKFKKGKIVEATSSNSSKLNEVLDSDEGARYIGEFALGFNPYCCRPMKDILFDEKIAGSLHFTPGNCYQETDNGNRSSIHWDMVLMQNAEKGGGEIYLDGKLIRKDGLFVLPELQALNPDQLR